MRLNKTTGQKWDEGKLTRTPVEHGPLETLITHFVLEKLKFTELVEVIGTKVCYSLDYES